MREEDVVIVIDEDEVVGGLTKSVLCTEMASTNTMCFARPMARSSAKVLCVGPYKKKQSADQGFASDIQKRSVVISLAGLAIITGTILWKGGGLETMIQDRCDRLEKRLDKVDARFDKVDARIDAVLLKALQ